MNLGYLKTFEVVASYSSFAKAAELLYISQPAVSQQIKSIENELGFALFERNPHNVKLTAAGERFRKGVADILKIYESTLRECQSDIPGEVTIHVYFLGYMNYVYLPEVLRRFQNEYPQCKMESIRLTPSEAIEKMRNGENGFFFVPECILPYHKDMESVLIHEEKHHVVMRKGNPLDNGKSIELEELCGKKICLASPQYRPSHMELTVKKLRDLEIPPVIMEALGVDNTLPVLLSSDNVAIMPGYTVPYHPEIISAVLEDGVKVPVVMASVAKKTSLEKAFSKMVMKYAEDQSKKNKKSLVY